MKNKNVWGMGLAILLISLVDFSASGQQSGTVAKPAQDVSPSAAGAAASSQKVVMKVGDTKVTQSEIEDLVAKLGTPAKVMVARQGRRPLGEEYVKMLLLSQRAVVEHLDSSPAIRSQLELQRAQTLAEAQYQDMSHKIQVGQEEVSQYFTAHRSEFETVKVREFTIRKRPEGSNDPKKGLPVGEARAKADLIRKALLAGTDIEEVAGTYADPPTITLVDKKVRVLRRSEMMKALETATFPVKDGGVTEPVETNETIYVVKVFGHDNPEFKEVAEEIEGTLRQQKLDGELDDMRKKAGVWMDEEYFTSKPAASGSAAQPSGTPKP
jgi:hypothetical protein